MNQLIELYKAHQTMIFVSLLLLLAAVSVFLLKKMFSRRQKKKELTRVSEDKRRDENLNNIILNSHKGKRIKEIHKPYDVDYGRMNGENSCLGNHSEQENNSLMIQLVERTELSTRKFVLNLIKPIRIGSDLQENDITIFAGNVSPCQCEIFAAGNKIYIRNMSPDNRTILKRKKKKAIVDGTGVRLLSGDTVILGSISYDITIMDKRIYTKGAGR